jgi:hypothetical protein
MQLIIMMMILTHTRGKMVTGKDYLEDFNIWKNVQNGDNSPRFTDVFDGNTLRHIITPRDLTYYVHFDALFEAYLNAFLILETTTQIMGGLGAPFDPGNPYVSSN